MQITRRHIVADLDLPGRLRATTRRHIARKLDKLAEQTLTKMIVGPGIEPAPPSCGCTGIVHTCNKQT
jgi:hypothetical protein